MIIYQRFLIFFACLLCVRCANNKTFVATEEWQTIEDGIEVPAGLHVRINLKTGKKEAKLLKEDNSNSKTSLISTKHAEEIPTVEDIKKILKNIKNDDVRGNSFKVQKFRSFEDIKSELSGVDLNIKTDFEILSKLMEEYQSIRNKAVQVENNEGRLEVIVLELNDLLHQYDNAIEFTRLKGFEEYVVPCLNSSSDGPLLRSNMLKLVVSASQNNPRVQKSAVIAGCVPLFLRLLTQDDDLSVRTRSVSALSSVLRQNPTGLLGFLKQGGLPVLASVFDDEKRSDDRIRAKIINLMIDWLREMRDSTSIAEKHIERSYEGVIEHFGARDGGWCYRASTWFIFATTEGKFDHGAVEAAATLLIELANQDCGDDFRINLQLMLAVNITKQLYEDLALHDEDEGKTESYFFDILNILRELLAILAGTTKYRDEL